MRETHASRKLTDSSRSVATSNKEQQRNPTKMVSNNRPEAVSQQKLQSQIQNSPLQARSVIADFYEPKLPSFSGIVPIQAKIKKKTSTGESDLTLAELKAFLTAMGESETDTAATKLGIDNAVKDKVMKHVLDEQKDMILYYWNNKWEASSGHKEFGRTIERKVLKGLYEANQRLDTDQEWKNTDTETLVLDDAAIALCNELVADSSMPIQLKDQVEAYLKLISVQKKIEKSKNLSKAKKEDSSFNIYQNVRTSLVTIQNPLFTDCKKLIKELNIIVCDNYLIEGLCDWSSHESTNQFIANVNQTEIYKQIKVLKQLKASLSQLKTDLTAKYTTNHNRRVFIHPDADDTPKKYIDNAVGNYGGGRGNPHKPSDPVRHNHVEGYSKNVIFRSEKIQNSDYSEVSYVLGYITFHIDNNMSGREIAELDDIIGRKLSECIEYLHDKNNQFVPLEKVIKELLGFS